MKVLLVAMRPIRGVCERVFACMSRYAKDVEIRMLVNGTWLPGIRLWKRDGVRPRHPYYDYWSKPDVEACLEWADVVHFYNHASPKSLGRLDLFDEKPCALQFHVAWNQCGLAAAWPDADVAKVNLSVVAEGWERYLPSRFPKPTILPALQPIDEPDFLPVQFEERKRVMASSFAGFQDHAKGAGELERVFKKANVPYDPIIHAPFPACMRRKALAWAGVEELRTPIFHFSGFEFLSLGVPCFNRWDEASERVLLETTGAPSVPFLAARESNLAALARASLSSSADAWRERSAEARAWMERWYNPRDMVERYLSFWRALA